MLKKLKIITAGESHGEALMGIIEGLPAGLKINENDINLELQRRQHGYGRSPRMTIETDKAKILSGIKNNETTGAPICVIVYNKDYRKELKEMTKPRPGHADLSGMMKFLKRDFSVIAERASARETVIRVSLGAICKIFLKEFGIKIFSYVKEIHGVGLKNEIFNVEKIYERIEKSPLRCPDPEIEKKMIKEIDKATQEGDSVGGIFKVYIKNCPPGLGSYTQWDLRLDARISFAIMSIPAVRGVEIGLGFNSARKFGSEVHDKIYYSKGRFYRMTNNAGGIEGGISNGEDIILTGVMKPISTLKKPLKTIDMKTKKTSYAEVIRADICAVPSCAIISEAMVAIVLSDSLLEKFGGDTMTETISNFKNYILAIRDL